MKIRKCVGYVSLTDAISINSISDLAGLIWIKTVGLCAVMENEGEPEQKIGDRILEKGEMS